MDELEALNEEDINELEARLYAQIHHEAKIEEPKHVAEENTCATPQNQQQNELPAATQCLAEQSVGAAVNKNFANIKSTKQIDNDENHSDGNVKETQKQQNVLKDTITTTTKTTNVQNNSTQSDTEAGTSKQKQRDGIIKTPDLRLNPIAKARAKANKKQQLKKNAGSSAKAQVQKNFPFDQQMQRLQKAIHVAQKKQKAKNAFKPKKEDPAKTINLISSDEGSSNDDIILVPVPPPPIYTVEDSDDDEGKVLPIDENALDASDVAELKNRSNANLVSTSSRCTSPCSVLSTDDFIGQSDRTRLLADNVLADDEDLRLLTSDVSNLLNHTSTNQKQTHKNSENMVSEVAVMSEKSPNINRNNFVSPNLEQVKNRTASAKQNYRVEQSEFRAVDVYDSESDITDNVYSKGTTKPTVICNLASSSNDDDINDVIMEPSVMSRKTKRLRKRRASGSNKESETNNDQSSNSSSESVRALNLTNTTGVKFITRGPAVEHCKTKRFRKVSLCSRRASAGGDSVGRMSDNEFIATLNNLAQGGEGACNDDDDSETGENVPTARDIAAQVLAKENQTSARSSAKEVVPPPIQNDSSSTSIVSVPITVKPNADALTEAVPDDTLVNLEKIFATIDRMDNVPKEKDTTNLHTNIVDSVVDVNDDHDSDVEIVKNIAETSASKPDSAKDPAERYFVIYNNGGNFVGGLGWNEEMRRFYNNSWRGEKFNLKDVWRQMDNTKSLWKIYTDDRFPKVQRHRNLKCYNCCEFGHVRAKCSRPKKALICYMCGESGHLEPRCPNTICLRCGNKTQVFTKFCDACSFQNRLICPVCKVRGHTVNFCPDKWRRYHSTTVANAYPNSNVEYKRRKSCCICGVIGHLGDTCKSAVRFLEYPTITSYIKSHQKSYKDITLKINDTSVIAFNILYKPCEKFSFELAENTRAKDYYGRFLKAVGMDYLLKRKRKAVTVKPPTSGKKSKKSLQQSIDNSYSKTVQEMPTSSQNKDNAPDQVQEISESGNLDKSSTCDNSDDVNKEVNTNETIQIIDATDESNNSHTNNDDHVDEEVPDRFKTPSNVKPTQQTVDLAETTNEIVSPKSTEKEAIIMDSDSNYSFSEHFAMEPNRSAIVDKVAEETEAQQARPRIMEPLPDFIPLTSTSDKYNVDEESEEDVVAEVGISRRFVSADSRAEDSDAGNSSPSPDLPCEAKIYLTHFHSNYLLSPAGHKFLTDKANDCKIKARLDWTSVGHVLIIYGLSANQDQFHSELLSKYRELTDEMNKKRMETSQKLPKRIDSLIRFLRDDINQLFRSLGSVGDLMRRLRQSENQRSKSGFKIAEKTRRLLNMILVGQAGLLDGNKHLDNLLSTLKHLINDYQPDYVVTTDLRNEIDSHWKVIFTGYHHGDYSKLVDRYNNLVLKNRIPTLNIDPILLGGRVLDTSLTSAQKERLENTKNNNKNAKMLNKKSDSPPPPPPSMKLNVTDSSIAPPAPSMKIVLSTTGAKGKDAITTPIKHNSNKSKNEINTPGNSTSTKRQQTTPQPPFTNPQRKSNVPAQIRNVANNLESACHNLLTAIDENEHKKPGAVTRDCKAPSMFWSRECIKYIDECIKLAKPHSDFAEKLLRVQKKSLNGLLSYNDYRSVIKFHNTMLNKN